MPRDTDKDNARLGRRAHGGGKRGDRPAGAKRPSGTKRSFAKSGDRDRDQRPPRTRFAREDRDQRPRPSRDERSSRDERPSRIERPGRGPRKDFAPRERDGERRPYRARDERPRFERAREDRPQRGERPRFERSREDRPQRGERPRFERAREDRPQRAERPRFERSREDRPQRGERPRFARPREDRPEREERAPRARRDERGRAPSREAWQDHPRSERRARGGAEETPAFAKRKAFGGRGPYRERDVARERRAAPPPLAPKKTGERIAKVLARAGLCSRRDAEEWIVAGRVAVNGRIINSPALDVTPHDIITVDGERLPERERTRLFLYHKPRGLMTTHADPEGRPTVFENLPDGLPRLISIGRLDFNTEGLLLLTNDGGLARVLELPETGWLRRYRVRAHGEVTQAQLDELRKGITVDGVRYGPIEAALERDSGANVWLTVAIREGKNREVRNVLSHLGLEVNRLIRVSYGPFQLGEIAEGAVEEVRSRVLREQLGERIIAQSGALFDAPLREQADDEAEPRRKERVAPAGRSALIADRKGRRVLVQRTGGAEARARNEDDAHRGPPRRPKRGYHGKRDLKPKADLSDD